VYSRIYTRLPWFFDYIGEPEEDEILFGDTNFDGLINIQDIILGVNFVLSSTTPTDEEYIVTDINQDSILNILDIIEMINLVLNTELTFTEAIEWFNQNLPQVNALQRLKEIGINDDEELQRARKRGKQNKGRRRGGSGLR
jgi:hypothetical protein